MDGTMFSQAGSITGTPIGGQSTFFATQHFFVAPLERTHAFDE
jgi:hypothetical protein